MGVSPQQFGSLGLSPKSVEQLKRGSIRQIAYDLEIGIVCIQGATLGKTEDN